MRAGAQAGAATVMVAERGAAAILGGSMDVCSTGQVRSREPVAA